MCDLRSHISGLSTQEIRDVFKTLRQMDEAINSTLNMPRLEREQNATQLLEELSSRLNWSMLDLANAMCRRRPANEEDEEARAEILFDDAFRTGSEHMKRFVEAVNAVLPPAGPDPA